MLLPRVPLLSSMSSLQGILSMSRRDVPRSQRPRGDWTLSLSSPSCGTPLSSSAQRQVRPFHRTSSILLLRRPWSRSRSRIPRDDQRSRVRNRSWRCCFRWCSRTPTPKCISRVPTSPKFHLPSKYRDALSQPPIH